MDVRLSDLLRQARPAPALPPRFEESVWRRIERQELPAATSAGWLDQMVAALVRPRLAVAAIAAILLFGGILGTVDGTTDAREAARERYVASVAPTSVR